MFTFASSIALLGMVILGNAYIAPCTGLHLTPSTLLNNSVTRFAFSLSPANTSFFPIEIQNLKDYFFENRDNKGSNFGK